MHLTEVRSTRRPRSGPSARSERAFPQDGFSRARSTHHYSRTTIDIFHTLSAVHPDEHDAYLGDAMHENYG